MSFFIKFTQEFCPYNFKLTEKITPNNKSMIQAFSLIFNFSNIASPCGDMRSTKVKDNSVLECARLTL